jgi:hypothetical protein
MIDPEMDLGGLEAIAVVDKPAIELTMQLFEEQDIELQILSNLLALEFEGFNEEIKALSFAEQMEEQQIIASPIMVANKMIARVDDETGEPYEVYFAPEDIKNLSYKLMKDKLIDSINFNHNQNDSTTNITLVESWLVEDPANDKSTLLGYNLKKGDWFGFFKVWDKQEWSKIKNGEYNGLSVEGSFIEKVMSIVK